MVPPTAPVSRLRGVGARLAGELARAGIERVADLFWLLPLGYDDLSRPLGVAQAIGELAAERVIVRGRVLSAGNVFLGRRRATRVVLGDASGSAKLTLWWFFAAHGVLARARQTDELIAAGRVSVGARGARMAHPDVFTPGPELSRPRPRYPRAGLSPERVRALVERALGDSEIPELVPAFVAEREGFGPLGALLRSVHLPERIPDPGVIRDVREQLAWAEAFCRVLLRRLGDDGRARRAPGIEPDRRVLERLSEELGFAFTAGQARAIDELGADLAAETPMRRLIVGDVGSGKTAVALAAVAWVVAARKTAIVFAPTAVLAEQYAGACRALERATGARVAILTARTPARERAAIERALAARELDVLVGTHALLDQSLSIPELALVVVDEQQRFGVAQRLAIASKGEQAPHVLTLSATPIPRTLALSLRGEIATSTIEDRPPGVVTPITELCARSESEPSISAAIAETIERGQGAFVVCPRIGDDDDDEGSGAVARHAELAERFGAARVGLAHGRLPPRELSRALERFRARQTLVLVGTSVVEVGIDVPHATLMVVDGAEHFGLSELHQLRGRVGRSALGGRCLLVFDEPLGELSRARLNALVELRSGAEIARRDLELRGQGDLRGTRQSGEAGMLFLDAFADARWLERIPSDVERVLDEDPRLERHPGLALFALRSASALALSGEAA